MKIPGCFAMLMGAAILTAASAQTIPVAPAPALATPLTINQAEQLALKNNPHIAVGHLLALAEGQVAREARSAELPIATGNLTAVESHPGSRITAGALNNPVVYERAAGGVAVSQLISDFGRTRNLIASAGLQARSQESAAAATEADVILAVDQAFYRALGSQAVLQVAQQTVANRSTVSDQVNALTAAKLKSTLDLSFANVNLSQAKLLLLDAQNTNQEAMATLNALLGQDQTNVYALVDETPQAPPLPPEAAAPLIAAAMQTRPDLRSLEENYEAANKFSRAEHELTRPTVSALGAVGAAPVRSDQITSEWYGAVGANISIPIFNGFLYSARAKEADYRAGAAKQQVDELSQAISRDVTVAVLQSQSNFQRIGVTKQLLDQANLALDLAQTRYQMGLSSIVELSQAQLAQTEAEIDYATARYSYEGSLAVIRFQTGQ